MVGVVGFMVTTPFGFKVRTPPLELKCKGGWLYGQDAPVGCPSRGELKGSGFGVGGVGFWVWGSGSGFGLKG